MAIKYKVIEQKEDPLDTVVEVSGLSDTITIREISLNVEKAKKELERQKNELILPKAVIENLKHFHPEAFTMDEKLATAVYARLSNENKIKNTEQIIENYENAIKADEKSIKEILEKTGLVLSTK